MKLPEIQNLISNAFQDRSQVSQKNVQEALAFVLRELELGRLRVASPEGTGPDAGAVAMTGDLRTWQVHAWVKEAILLTMGWRRMRQMGAVTKETGPEVEQGRVHGTTLSYYDKLDVRSDLAEHGVRVVPPGTVREGAYVSRGAVIMPGYVNIGAYVSEGVMVDTWATVGSCAQIGARVHLAGGVGIGGVLEPAGARPVIIGDDAFIGSRCIVVEGAIVSSRAVLGAGVCLTATTPVYDVTQSAKSEFRGYVPPGAVVAPGTREKEFPGGKVPLQCAYIIGYRNDKTDARVGINDILRENGLGV
jgi:2,3,4,5-tetrahydropyridine-2-carboxylate N-succinyltransferase